jgi:hypothetical protein
VTARKALIRGLGVGIAAYLALIGFLTLFGVSMDDLLPYASCMVSPNSAETQAGECSWLPSPPDSDEIYSRDRATGALDGIRLWGSNAVDAAMTFTDKFVIPLANRLVKVGEFVSRHFELP